MASSSFQPPKGYTNNEYLDEMITREEELDHLDDTQREEQLSFLIHEIKQVIIYNPPLNNEWYTRRMKIIYDYATQIDWKDMSERFEGKDHYISSTSREIHYQLDQLIKEWEYRSTISLPIYYRVLHDIQEVWKQYQMKYVGDMTDSTVVNLTEQMTYVWLSK